MKNGWPPQSVGAKLNDRQYSAFGQWSSVLHTYKNNNNIGFYKDRYIKKETRIGIGGGDDGGIIFTRRYCHDICFFAWHLQKSKAKEREKQTLPVTTLNCFWLWLRLWLWAGHNCQSYWRTWLCACFWITYCTDLQLSVVCGWFARAN